MSQTYQGGPMTITVVGTTVTTGAASASASIPTDAAGNTPRYIRVSATTESYINVAAGAAPVATTNNILVQPADAVVLAVPSGVTKFAYIQGTSIGKINVVPLDNV